MEAAKKILIVSSDKNLREVLNFCFEGWGYEVLLEESLSLDINRVKKTSPDAIVIDVQSAKKSQLEICQVLKDDFATAFIPIITIINKRQLRQQLLNVRQGIDDYLIKPPDPLDLRIRVEMAVRRSEFNYYASPLTGLPGGRIIEEVLKDKIKAGLSFSFAHADIDNFKYFNDTYGHIKGDRAIMNTAYILHTTMARFGNNSDFVGHIGGDDFVFITTPDKHQDICRNFIMSFEKVAPFHYSQADRERGYIIARDRTRKTREIPLMSLSIAVVTRTQSSEIQNIIQINEKVAEIKHYLKGLPGSKFMADRRDLSSAADEPRSPHFFKRDEFLRRAAYRPLGQILVENRALTAEQLDEALKVHWERGVVLGEILKELGLVSENDLAEALKAQEKDSLNGRKNDI